MENDPQQTHEHLPRGAKAVIDARAATRLSAVVGDGEFAEFAVAVEEVAATGPAATAAAVMSRTAPVAAIGAATLACLWAGARMNHNFSDMAAHTAADGGSFGRLNAAASPMFGASRDRGELSGDPAMNVKNSARVAAMAVTAAVTANGALAGDAVQWRVEDGGNGHWYNVSQQSLRWSEAEPAARAAGGHLASITSPAENGFIAQLWPRVESMVYGAWAGGIRTTTGCEPDCGWSWSSGDAWGYTNWWTGEPNDVSGQESCLEIFVYQSLNAWNDAPESADYRRRSVIEWEADCNSDGIVDYGQCHDGTLPDYNGNNIPDCCDQGVQCTVGNYPVQWRVEDGGNGHWYQFIQTTTPRTWQSARDWAPSIGSHLATLTSAVEQSFIVSIAPDFQDESGGQAWLGGYQDRNAPDFTEPYGGWRWITGEPVTYVGWVNSGDTPLAGADFLTLAKDFQGAFGWNALPTDYAGGRKFCFVEFDSDCNNDNIVDLGQILNGTLPDTNTNNIPDCCEPGNNCCLGDIYVNHIVDGGDLGVLLSEWGVVTPTTRSDLNRDGFVDGADLGRLLANWGPCGG